MELSFYVPLDTGDDRRDQPFEIENETGILARRPAEAEVLGL